MKKVILVLCVLLVVMMLSANSKAKFILHYEEYTNEEIGEFFREMTEQVRDNRDLYMLEVLHEEWVDDAWVYEGKDIYTYDGNGYLIEVLSLVWAEGDWQNSSKMVFNNNTEGYPYEYIMQMWEPVSETWIDQAIISIAYDADWNYTEMIIQMWFNGGWMNVSRITFTYNADNNPTYILIEEWDIPDGTEWENDGQETYTYDGLFLEEILDENWVEDSYWENDIRHTYTEAGNNFHATKLRQDWNNAEWVNSRYDVFTYDDDWFQTELLEQLWDNDAWLNHQNHYYLWEDGYMTLSQTYDWEEDRNWVNGSRDTVTYGTLDAEDNSIAPNNDLVLSNYPNPFSSTTTISFSVTQTSPFVTLEIYNLKGQQIRQFSINDSRSSIKWNGKDYNGIPVANGIYFYKMKSGKYSSTKKMILLR